MLSNWPIRYKLILELVLLVVMFAALSVSGMIGLYSYRNLVKSISGRAAELPIAADLGQYATDMRVMLTEIQTTTRLYATSDITPPMDDQIVYDQFDSALQDFENALARYRDQLINNERNSPSIGDSQRERDTVRKIQESVDRIKSIDEDSYWMFDDLLVSRTNDELRALQKHSAALPSFLHARMRNFAHTVRLRYRTLIYVTWITTLSMIVMLALFVRLFYTWVFRPLRILSQGSRRVASGDFSHRIRLSSQDEMSELAQAMNNMTERFQTIRDDLDQQVRDRTIQMVRNEQLASVGFLAAGVAHEINNPMASIAMCAESLERQINDGVVPDEKCADGARNYLRMIQEEAFRCKAITSQLLDFSRTDNGPRRQTTDTRELVMGVIEMVRHLAKNQGKNVDLVSGPSINAAVNPQEIKQVVLNLITNGLDSIDPGGTVTLELRGGHDQVEIIVQDNGCGMTPEVSQNLFEPFFTRRRSGQGTGLGLSIVYRIVADHGGRIEAQSDGPGKGSRFHVWLPIRQLDQHQPPHCQAA
ncbi:MAG: HAMP domain-containing sensor histidine kinase [Pirellulales bacterium]